MKFNSYSPQPPTQTFLGKLVFHPSIFIDMFAPKWARGPHNLARFPSWDPCITPGYWAWYLNVLPTSGSLFRSLFYAFMPREGIYTCVFCPPSSPQRRKPGYAALLRIRGNYFRPYLSIPRVCHRGAAYQWKFSYHFFPPTFYFHYRPTSPPPPPKIKWCGPELS